MAEVTCFVNGKVVMIEQGVQNKDPVPEPVDPVKTHLDWHKAKGDADVE